MAWIYGAINRAFTHVNRLCAYKMMEARQVYIGDQKFREAVSRGINSNGVKFYLADHPEDERLYSTGKQDVAYRHYLDWLGGLLSEEIGVLFKPHDSANRFLTDNTLGRIWYEMRKGETKLKDQCRYIVRRPSEVFLAEGETPTEPNQKQDELSQEELLKQPVHIPHRPKKDPRELRILDPACGSGHFLLYCFDLSGVKRFCSRKPALSSLPTSVTACSTQRW